MPKGKNRQLTLEDRIFIEDRIKARDSLSEAARRLGVSASTVSCEISEIKRNSEVYRFFGHPMER